MIIFLVLGLILGGLAVAFALQNVAVVTVGLFSWSLTGSLSTVLFLTIFLGATIATLIFLPRTIYYFFKYKSLTKANVKLEEELRKQKELTVFAKDVTPKKEDLAKIESGAIESTEM